MKYILFIRSMLAVLFSLSAYIAVSQEFAWRSELEKANTDGFCKIQLSPAVVSKLNHDFGDIRLYDKSGKEIPYIFEKEQAYLEKDYFVEYKVIEKKEETSWPYYTRIVIHNPKKNKISNIQLIIKNSDVSKLLKLSGSDDKKNWYIIKDSYRFQAMYSDVESSVIKIIDFPVSDYEYYEILIDDWKNNPINVLKAGFFNTSIEKGKYSEIAKPEISQLELKNEKQSLVKLNYAELQMIQKISFNIDGPEFYFRKAELQIRDSVADKRNKYKTFFNTVANITLSSNSSNTFYFDSLWAKELYLRIKNYDDEPVKVISSVGEQLNCYLVCKLENADSYQLKFGNRNVSLPIYDLKYFSNKIPEKVQVLKSGKIISTNTSVEKASTGIQLDKKYIWGAIILVVILLLYMVLKMLKDLKNSKLEKD